MDEVKLKPCPFCGKDIYIKIGYGGLRFFCCSKCGSITSFDTDYLNKNPQLAINYWNTRTDKIYERTDSM